jgi:hypothetical protein
METVSATSGATFFRSIGGTVGVAVFGAIFTNRLAANLTHDLPADVPGTGASRTRPAGAASTPTLT